MTTITLPRARRVLLVSVLLVLAAVAPVAHAVLSDPAPDVESAVPRATCDAASRPETGLQGQVPVADRASGRSDNGYTCNVRLLGRLAGTGAEWQMAAYGTCAYVANRITTARGVTVVDVRNPRAPTATDQLTSPAMLSPWESLKVNQQRGLLGAVFAPVQGLAWFDVYDVKTDCAHPQLLASIPMAGLGHEGDWSSDGRTYWATGVAPGLVTAIDVTNPREPVLLTRFAPVRPVHGFGISADGHRMYLAHLNSELNVANYTDRNLRNDNGVGIYDVSQVQDRRPRPTVTMVAEVTWPDGAAGQHSVPFTSGGTSYLLAVDELRNGGPRILDLSDERKPVVIATLKTEIQLQKNWSQAREDTYFAGETGGGVFGFGYNSHYCTLDRLVDPRLAMCSTFESGLRVFDIRDVRRPREHGYFNPGGSGVRSPSSWGGTTGGFTSARPHYVASRNEIWFTDQDKGFYTVRVKPLRPLSSRTPPTGLPQL